MSAQSSAPRAPLSVVPSLDSAPAQPRLSAHRRSGRTAASRALGVAAAATGSAAAVARSLGISESTVAHWADPDHPAAVTLGDILAAGANGRRDFARCLLVSALATIDDAAPTAALAPELIGLQLGAGVGAFQRSLLDALADGTLSDEERDEADKALVRLSLQISNARRTIKGAPK